MWAKLMHQQRLRVAKELAEGFSGGDMLNADQLLARLYALRKEYADDPEDETYQALHHAFMFISYHMSQFKEYVQQQGARAQTPKNEQQ